MVKKERDFEEPTEAQEAIIVELWDLRNIFCNMTKTTVGEAILGLGFAMHQTVDTLAAFMMFSCMCGMFSQPFITFFSMTKFT